MIAGLLDDRCTDSLHTVSENGSQELLATAAAGQILAGPAYDALIAFTTSEHDVTV